jgi:exodeoxyribonuclease-5
MRQKGIEDARTIHSVIYTPNPNEDGTVTFLLRPRYELADIDGFLVDETSMVSKQLHRDMLSFGKPIIFVGDHGQLPPVGDDVYLMADPDYKLEEIHRNAGPIAHFAGQLRKGGAAGAFKINPTPHSAGKIIPPSPSSSTGTWATRICLAPARLSAPSTKRASASTAASASSWVGPNWWNRVTVLFVYATTAGQACSTE